MPSGFVALDGRSRRGRWEFVPHTGLYQRRGGRGLPSSVAPRCPSGARRGPPMCGDGRPRFGACSASVGRYRSRPSCGHGCHPSDLRVCPSRLIVKPDKIRVGRHWSNLACGLNGLLVNPPVEFGDIDGLLGMPWPGAFVAGLEFQDCFSHWLASPAFRRSLGVRHPATRRLCVHLFLPFGLGPSPEWNDRYVREVLRVVKLLRPSPRVIDSVGDLRL